MRSTIDPIAGIHGAFAVLAALAHRDRTGEGRQIEMPMAEVAMNVAAEPIVTWSATGVLLERDGDRGAPGAPQGVYTCDGHEQWVALSITNDDEWRALVEVLGDTSWASDPALASGAGRRARHDELDAALSEWFAGRDRDETVDALLAAGVLAAPVWDQMIQDELPQLAERGFTPVARAPRRRECRLSRHRRAGRHLRQLVPGPRPDRRPAHHRGPHRAGPHRRRDRRPPAVRRRLTSPSPEHASRLRRYSATLTQEAVVRGCGGGGGRRGGCRRRR